MNFRRTITLASVGWYLMVPPGTGPYHAASLNLQAPLSQWEQFSAFDSASACENYRTSTIESLQKAPSEQNDANLRVYSNARCLASDDPRLAK